MVSIANLIKEMPEGYEQACYDLKAIQRKRGIDDPGNLLILSLFHLLNGCSLVEISEIASLTKMGAVSDVAFLKRFAKCNDWFRWINLNMVTNGAIEYEKPGWLEGYRVIAVDATDVTEKGRSGRLYHLHYAIDLMKMESVQFKVTTQECGESMQNYDIQENDLFVADRAYGTLKGIEHCQDGGGKYIFRLRTNHFSLFGREGNRVDLFEELRGIGEGKALGIDVCAKGTNGKTYELRVCAIRKTDDAIAAAQKRLNRFASKRQRTLGDDTKEFNEYIVLITNLHATISAEQVLETYRIRWQAELYFKRLKSIMDYGELPKRREDSAMAWLNGKLMIALLIERIIGKASFSPSGEQASKYMA